MKTSKTTMLLAVVLLLSACVAGERIVTRRQLEGTWYLNGDRSKVCSIDATRDGLIARNERGETSRVTYDRGGYVTALDWGNIRGEIRGNRIEWANNTYWVRSGFF